MEIRVLKDPSDGNTELDERLGKGLGKYFFVGYGGVLNLYP